MGMKKIFGLGKKGKEPFRVPHDVSDLRRRIETEARENYPRKSHFEEIQREAERVHARLEAIIEEHTYADEALRIKEDLDKKLEGLANKIQKNLHESTKEGRDDYLESNIEYLERKNMRNKAKTLFMYFLEQVESFEKYCSDGKLDSGKTIEAETANFYKNILDLNNNYLIKHRKDREIQVVKREVIKKMSDLNRLYNENKTSFQEQGLSANIEASLKQIFGG